MNILPLMVAASINVCDLDKIYNDDFNYSLPRKVLESYFSGRAFDHKVEYSPEERARLDADVQEIWQRIIEQNPLKEKVVVMAAGAPGAGKSTVLKQELAKMNVAFICPDDICLKQQKRTYCQERSDLGDVEAYNKWRPGSNAACHSILANLIREGYALYFGTTSTGDKTNVFLKWLHERGYTIKLIHVTAPDDVRFESLKKRDQEFFQTTPEDVVNKGKLLPQRINDTYLAFADEIDFRYRGGVDEDAVVAAKWVRGRGLEIIDPVAYDKLKAIHDASCVVQERPDLLWENSVETRIQG